VVKSLEANLHGVAGIAGATILGDGHVALILDVSAVIRASATRNLARSAA
jgi:two-component system chemotaxis sensor kinase CheA